MIKRKENILYSLLIIVFAIAIIAYKNYRRKEDDKISIKGEITVGFIFNRNLPGARTISSTSYNYIYYVDNNKYEGGSLSDKKYPEGSYFEVMYLPENPEKSRMKFNKPVPLDSVCTYFEEKCPFE